MDEKLIKNIKKLMEIHGDNSYTLAEKTGISQPTINRILTGEHENSRLNTFIKIAEAYQVKLSQLIGEIPLEFDSSGEPVEIFYTSNKKLKILYKTASKANNEQIDKIQKICDVFSESTSHNNQKKKENE